MLRPWLQHLICSVWVSNWWVVLDSVCWLWKNYVYIPSSKWETIMFCVKCLNRTNSGNQSGAWLNLVVLRPMFVWSVMTDTFMWKLLLMQCSDNIGRLFQGLFYPFLVVFWRFMHKYFGCNAVIACGGALCLDSPPSLALNRFQIAVSDQ